MRRALTTLAAIVTVVTATTGHATPADFPSPPALQPPVRFWTRIYTEVGTDAALIHDPDNLDVVYERVDFPSELGGREVDSRYESTKAKYREILRRLAAGERENLGPDEQRVLRLFPPGVSAETLRRASESVRLQRGQADRFREGLVRAGAWEDHIERTLQRKGLPKELATLPHVESSYNPMAYSKVGAAGLWQFMPGTGRTFSLRVNDVVDERMDPFRATEAACDLLEHNHDALGTWPLALTAYNHGAGGMARAIRELGTNDIAEIVRRYDGPGFGFASRNFYTSFLAAREASANATRYFGEIRKQAPTEYRVVRLEKPFSVKTLKSALGVDLDTLQAHNLALRDGFWSGRRPAPAGVTVRVPKGPTPANALSLARAERWRPKSPGEAPPTVEARPADPPAEPNVATTASATGPVVERTGTVIHVLRGGETVAALSRRYGVPTSVILGVNHVRSPRDLKAGDRLRIPEMASEPAADPAPIAQTAAVVEAAAPAAPADDTQSAAIAQAPVQPETSAPPAAQAEPPEGEPSPAPPAAEPVPIVIEPEPEPLGAVVAALQRAEDAEPVEEAPLGSALPERAAPARTTERAASAAVASRRAAEPSREKAEAPAKAEKSSAKRREANDPHELARDTLDRGRYAVGPKSTITIQPDESLARIAQWVGSTPAKLRALNRLSRKAEPGAGRKLRLDFEKVSARKFEARRIAYHQELRSEFFDAFEVAGTEQRVVRKGDTLRSLTRGKPPVPTWLLDHYNPNVDLGALKPGNRVVIPKLEKRTS